MRTDLRDDEPVEVQMAPLIDCVFLLLIFFLVATTLKKIDEELPLTLPEANKAVVEVQQPDDWMVISIDQDGEFYLDGTPIAIDLLQSDVRARARNNPDVKVRVDADAGVAFQRVMEILDLLRFEKISNIGINTNQDK